MGAPNARAMRLAPSLRRLDYSRKWTVWPSPYFGQRRLPQRPLTHFVPAGDVAIQPPHCEQRASVGGALTSAGAGSRGNEAATSHPC
jgi:hypothetical protein